MSKKRKRHQKPTELPDPSLMREGDVCSEYGFNGKTLKKYLPPPALVLTTSRGTEIPCWRRADVLQALEQEEVKAAVQAVIQRRTKRSEVQALREARAAEIVAVRQAKEEAERLRKQQEEEKKQRVFRYLSGEYGLESLMRRAAFLERQFVLHVGPTNSGKTYDALTALRGAGSGIYLGPLRLLALEMFDKLNETGCRCTLLTGEEHIEVEGAEHMSSTIELCNYQKRYDVAVIDEAQMLSDPSRGANWTRALLGVDAAEVHVCVAPEGRSILTWLLDQIGAPYTMVRHRRLCPLRFSGLMESLDDVQPGDALITFSRVRVLGVSAELEKRGIRASVIYGALPPESRREEVRKFAAGETSVVVATDAIGMGISLPIRRVIFCETQKFDGVRRRPLERAEIQQIAGRAGRFGLYNRGEVLTFADPELVQSALRAPARQIRNLTMPFPTETLDSDFSLEELLRAWQSQPLQSREQKADMSDALYLVGVLGELAKGDTVPKALIYDLITCPVDTSSRDLVFYWKKCVLRIVDSRNVPMPKFDVGTLEGCELQYRALDVYSQLRRRLGEEVSVQKEKRELSRQINMFLSEDKQSYERRCAACQKLLPFNWPYRICEDCRFLRLQQHTGLRNSEHNAHNAKGRNGRAKGRKTDAAATERREEHGTADSTESELGIS